MEPYAPFAGRHAAIARVRQHISDPVHTPVPAFIGRRSVGKTALLQQFAGMPTDTHIGVYLPCKEIAPQDELHWLTALYNATHDTLTAYGFNINITPPEDFTTAEPFKQWFKENYLAAVFRIIYRARRVVFLIDDAEILVQTMMRDTLAEDYFGYLNELRHPQCAVVFTISIAYENRLELFYTITDDGQFSRLGDLDEAETADALHQHNPDIHPAATQDIFRATGGQPGLISMFLGYLPTQNPITEAEVKQITPQVYPMVKDQFRELWDELSLDERLILTAIGSLLYADPMRAVTASNIETWLVETDYLLDLTSIHAAIRSLDYRELVAGSAAQRLSVRPGLLQKWMLENVRLDATTHDGVSPGAPGTAPSQQANTAVLVMGIVGIVLLLMLILFIAGTPRTSSEAVSIPTTTISAPD